MRSLWSGAESVNNNNTNKPILSVSLCLIRSPSGRQVIRRHGVSIVGRRASGVPVPAVFQTQRLAEFRNRCFTRHLNISDTKFLPIAFTNQPLGEGHVLTLEVHRVHSASTNQDNYTMIIGVMTCFVTFP